MEGESEDRSPRSTYLRRKMTKMIEAALPGARVSDMWCAVGSWRSGDFDCWRWGGRVSSPEYTGYFGCYETMTACARAGSLVHNMGTRRFGDPFEFGAGPTKSTEARADVGNGGE